MSAQAPVGTTLAILERMLKVMSAVQARVHFALKQEFKLLKGIIRDYTDADYDYDVDGTQGRMAKKSDFEHVEIIPVSDPNAATMGQRIVQYQAVMQLAQAAPQIYDLQVLHRQMLEVLGVKNANKIIPMDEDQKPKDPVTENVELLKSKPAKAFDYQDHEAHLAVHSALVSDPSLQQTMQSNPMGGQIMAAIQAHIMEHVAFKYRRDVEMQLGVTLPPMDQPMDEETEMAVSKVSAMAAQQLLQANIAKAQQQQAQQAAQDPIVQMQMQELQLKAQDTQRKMMETQARIQNDQAKIAIESKRIDAQARQNNVKNLTNALKGNRGV